MAKKTAKTIPKAHPKPAPKSTPAKAQPMAQDKPAAVQQAAPPPPKPKLMDAGADILTTIAGTFDRGAHGTVGEETAQRIIDTLTAAGYTIS